MDKPFLEVLCDQYGYLCSEDPRNVAACTLNAECIERLSGITVLENGSVVMDLDEGRINIDLKNVPAEAVWSLMEAGVHFLELVIIGHEDEDLTSESTYILIGPNYPATRAAAEFLPKHKGRNAQVLAQTLTILNTD